MSYYIIDSEGEEVAEAASLDKIREAGKDLGPGRYAIHKVLQILEVEEVPARSRVTYTSVGTRKRKAKAGGDTEAA